MRFIINENKLKKTLINFFEDNPQLNNLISRETWLEGGLNFYRTDEEHPDYSFTYWPTFEDFSREYDADAYDEIDFPLIEVNYELWSKLDNLFGEKILKTVLLDWINERYGLSSKEIHPG